jgi:hypothetical protein
LGNEERVFIPHRHVTAYMVFRSETVTGKTGRWTIRNVRSGDILGEIRWYGAWRQYTFMPVSGTVFNVGCMEDITRFIKERMQERKEDRVASVRG